MNPVSLAAVIFIFILTVANWVRHFSGSPYVRQQMLALDVGATILNAGLIALNVWLGTSNP